MQPADAAPSRIFLLSPANCSGLRARMVLAETAGFELARRLREPGGAPLGEIFSFVSGLYFRGKLAYARAFARPPSDLPAAGALVIAPGAGLWPAERAVTLADLRALAAVSVSAANPRHRRPLLESATALAALIDAECEVVLLGSIASDKYVEVLVSVFGERLRFPVDFVGRGDMSRGGLMLRCVAQGRELTYAPVLGAVRHGVRVPRLPALAAQGIGPSASVAAPATDVRASSSPAGTESSDASRSSVQKTRSRATPPPPTTSSLGRARSASAAAATRPPPPMRSRTPGGPRSRRAPVPPEATPDGMVRRTGMPSRSTAARGKRASPPRRPTVRSAAGEGGQGSARRAARRRR